MAMNKYIEYLMKVWEDLSKLPPKQFDERMKGICSPSIIKALNEPIVSSDEPIVYCEPTPKAFAKLTKVLETINE
jgi:hypothetical protein